MERTVTMALPDCSKVELPAYFLIVGNINLVSGASGASMLITWLSDSGHCGHFPEQNGNSRRFYRREFPYRNQFNTFQKATIRCFP